MSPPNRTGLTRAALEAVISGKMRPDALFGESRAEEPARRGEESFRGSRWAEARARPRLNIEYPTGNIEVPTTTSIFLVQYSIFDIQQDMTWDTS